MLREQLFQEIKSNKIYKFTNLTTLLDILLRNELTFLKPDLWDDTYEMAFAKKYVDMHINKLFSRNIDEFDFDEFLPVLSVYNKYDLIYGQCWTELPESDALWRIYSDGGKSIRLCTDIEKVKQLSEVFAVKVAYSELKDPSEIKDLPEEISEYDLYKMICTKRTAFSHEKEIRLITSEKRDVNERDFLYAKYLELFKRKVISDCNGILTAKDEEPLLRPYTYEGQELLMDDYIQIMKKYEKPDIKRIKINAADFIESVMVNPFAPDYFCKTIELLCEKYYIPYLGKSELYNSMPKNLI